MAWFSDRINSNYRKTFLELSVAERSRFLWRFTWPARVRLSAQPRWMAIYFNSFLFYCFVSCQLLELWGPREAEEDKFNFNFPPRPESVLCCLFVKIRSRTVFWVSASLLLLKFFYVFFEDRRINRGRIYASQPPQGGSKKQKKLSRVCEFITY